MNRLSNEHVDRIARSVVGKLVLWLLVILVGVWVAPLVPVALISPAREV